MLATKNSGEEVGELKRLANWRMQIPAMDFTGRRLTEPVWASRMVLWLG